MTHPNAGLSINSIRSLESLKEKKSRKAESIYLMPIKAAPPLLRKEMIGSTAKFYFEWKKCLIKMATNTGKIQ